MRPAVAAVLALATACAASPESKPNLVALPVFFEPAGEASGVVEHYVARNTPYAAAISSRGVHLHLPGGEYIRLIWLDSNPRATLAGVDRLPGQSNYFLGSDPGRWRTGVPQFAGVMARSVYPGIDAVVRGSGGTLEYDFIVEAGADPRLIRIRVEGSRKLRITGDGHLLIQAAGGELVSGRPFAYQRRDGRKLEAPAGYRLLGRNVVAFDIQAPDPPAPLTIDPVLSFSSYFGGPSSDYGRALAVDGSGNVYITGATASADFPVQNAFQSAKKGVPPPGPGVTYDAFVAKMNTNTKTVLYSTYLGSSQDDSVYSIAIDTAGNTYITGYANGADFPLKNALRTAFSGSEAFVTKLNSAGDEILYSTFLGGAAADSGHSIVAGGDGAAYVAGWTGSPDFPLQYPYQAALAGSTDVFLAKLTPAGDALVFSTFLGGTQQDSPSQITLDAYGNILIVGTTFSGDFPVLNPVQTPGTVAPSSPAAFVTKMNSTASALIYSTYLGAYQPGVGGNTSGRGIAVDSQGNALVTGTTDGRTFPLLNPLQTSPGRDDCFITRLTPAGSLAYSTLLGSGGDDQCHALALDGAGRIWVAGNTSGRDFPLLDPVQSTIGGWGTGVVFQLSADGQAILFSTFLGTTQGQVEPGRLALDSSGTVYLVSSAWAAGFPTVNPIYGYKGSSDVTISKITGQTQCSYTVSTVTPPPIPPQGGTGAISVTTQPGCFWNAVSHNLVSIIGPNTAPGGGPATGYGTWYEATGSGPVSFMIGNAEGPDRSFGIIVAGRKVTVTQQGYGCHPQLQSSSASLPAAGGSGSFTVSDVSGCPYQAVSNAPWLLLTEGSSGTGGGIVRFYAGPNTTGAARQATISVGSLTFTVSQDSLPPQQTTGIFRDSSGSIWLVKYNSSIFYPAGRIFASNPAAAQTPNGITYVTARDPWGSLWLNSFDQATSSWGGWLYAGGIFQGDPAIAVAGNGWVFLAGRDTFNSYWIRVYKPGIGFESWFYLGGIFGSDPVMAAYSDSSVYIIGKDAWRSLWAASYSPGFLGVTRRFGGGIIKGMPSVTTGTDSVAYVAARDDWDGLWLARLSGSGWLGWAYGGGILGSDPKVAFTPDGRVRIAARDPWGVFWTRSFVQGTSDRWQSWEATGGVLEEAAAAGNGNDLYLFGRSSTGVLWWYKSAGPIWSSAGSPSAAPGSLTAAPR